jgi:hypothetical protein
VAHTLPPPYNLVKGISKFVVVIVEAVKRAKTRFVVVLAIVVAMQVRV